VTKGTVRKNANKEMSTNANIDVDLERNKEKRKDVIQEEDTFEWK
jgi:hypothetical protein